jgi:hypothetical protein
VPARLINGSALAQAIRQVISLAISRTPARRRPGITVIQVGGDPASSIYVRNKHRAAEAAGYCENEGWRVRRDGSLFWANVVVTALRDRSGNLCGFAKVMRDLTRRRQVEEELRRLNQELETRVAARTAALENANRRLGESVDALQERTREISVLSEMAGTLQACQSAEEAFHVIERAIPRLFPGQPGSLAFASSEKQTVEIVASWGGKVPRQLAFSPVDCWAMRMVVCTLSTKRLRQGCAAGISMRTRQRV